MPELPEVEVTKRGIAPYLQQRTIVQLVVRQRQLRWQIPQDMESLVEQQQVRRIERRGKYILVYINDGALLFHLGMSGSLRVLDGKQAPTKHDHYDLINDHGQIIRYHDPRRFGALLYQKSDPYLHPLISHLGVEPLTDEFDGNYLYRCSRNRKIAIKQFIMNSKIVVGVGNIYASESLFLSGIHPTRAACRISIERMHVFAKTIKKILQNAIDLGGTTLQDFVNPDKKPGYFQQTLKVYDREDQACRHCGVPIRRITQQQRSTFYCPSCQR